MCRPQRDNFNNLNKFNMKRLLNFLQPIKAFYIRIVKWRYYFITYQAHNRDGSKSIWNDVTDKNPMEFIKDIEDIENNGTKTYNNFIIINTCKISRKEFNKHNGWF